MKASHVWGYNHGATFSLPNCSLARQDTFLGVIRSWIGNGLGSEVPMFTTEAAIYFERFIFFGCSVECLGCGCEFVLMELWQTERGISNAFRKFHRFFARNDNTLANLRKAWAEWGRSYQIQWRHGWNSGSPILIPC